MSAAPNSDIDADWKRWMPIKLTVTFICYQGDSLQAATAFATRYGVSISDAIKILTYGAGLFETEDRDAAISITEELREMGIASDIWGPGQNEQAQPEGKPSWMSFPQFESEQAITPQIASGPAVPQHAKQSTGLPTSSRRYKEFACDDCGQMFTKDQLHAHSYEIESGRQGSSTRTSVTTNRNYSSGFTANGSFTSRSGGGQSIRRSSSSGRKYYRTIHGRLCGTCLQSRLEQERLQFKKEHTIGALVWKAIKFLLT